MKSEIFSVFATFTLLSTSLWVFIGLMRSWASTDLLEPLSLAGPVISILGYISPLPSVQLAIQSGTASDLPFPMLASQLALCVVNAAYGSAIDNKPVLITNLIGIAFQLAWLAAWYYLRWRAMRQKQAHPGYFIVSAVTTVVMLVAAISRIESDLIGTLSVVMSVVYTISPLAQLGVVVRTKKTSTIPMTMTSMMFLGNVCWGLYGWILSNNVILLPCLLGFEISIFQIILYAWCKDQLPFELSFLGKIFPYEDLPRRDSYGI